MNLKLKKKKNNYLKKWRKRGEEKGINLTKLMQKKEEAIKNSRRYYWKLRNRKGICIKFLGRSLLFSSLEQRIDLNESYHITINIHFP